MSTDSGHGHCSRVGVMGFGSWRCSSVTQRFPTPPAGVVSGKPHSSYGQQTGTGIGTRIRPPMWRRETFGGCGPMCMGAMCSTVREARSTLASLLAGLHLETGRFVLPCDVALQNSRLVSSRVTSWVAVHTLHTPTGDAWYFGRRYSVRQRNGRQPEVTGGSHLLAVAGTTSDPISRGEPKPGTGCQLRKSPSGFLRRPAGVPGSSAPPSIHPFLPTPHASNHDVFVTFALLRRFEHRRRLQSRPKGAETSNPCKSL